MVVLLSLLGAMTRIQSKIYGKIETKSHDYDSFHLLNEIEL